MNIAQRVLARSKIKHFLRNNLEFLVFLLENIKIAGMFLFVGLVIAIIIKVFWMGG